MQLGQDGFKYLETKKKQALRSSCELLRQGSCQKVPLAVITLAIKICHELS